MLETTQAPLDRVNRREKPLSKKERNERAEIHFNGTKRIIEIKDERDGGIGILMSESQFDKLQIKEGNKVEVEIMLPTGKRGKVQFIVVYIKKTERGDYRMGLQYADKTNLSRRSRGISMTNTD